MIETGKVRRVLRGYAAGAIFTLFVVGISVGAAFPMVFIFGSFFALILGIAVVLPLYLLLERIGQLRVWWAALLGAVMVAALARELIFSGHTTEYVVMTRNFAGELVPHWFLLGYAAVGAIGGVIGWHTVYGCTLKPRPVLPESSERHAGDD